MRISTAGMNNQLISQAMRVQSAYTDALTQQSSGVKSESLSGLEGQAGATISLKSDIADSEHLATQAENASNRLQVAYSTVSTIADLVEKMRVSISAALDGSVSDASTVQTTASGYLSDVADLLNTQYADTYVFSGTSGQTKPVDLSDADYDPSTGADTDYYQGSTTLPAVMVSGDSGKSYGVTASDSSFEQVLRALSTLSTMTTDPADTATMQSAFDLLSTATTGLGEVQETLSDQASAFDTIVDHQTEFQIYANEALDSLTNVDVAEASAKVSQQEVLLQASFATLSSLKSVSVLDYL
jgi:flagellar hook-associated protein 3 FlgL